MILSSIPCRPQPVEVASPVAVLITAELVQVLPGVQTRIVTIVEHESDRVMTDRFYRRNEHFFFPGLQYLLAGAMASHLCRRGKNTQVLERQIELRIVVKTYRNHAGART